MKLTRLLIFLLHLIILNSIFAIPVHKSKSKYVKAPTLNSTPDVYAYLTKYGYNPCENQSGSNKTNGKRVLCQSSLESMVKEFQTRNGLPATGKADRKVLELMQKPRCGVKDRPLSFRVVNPWSKKSFTWKLNNENLPSFGEVKTREQLRQSFKDWTKYSPIEFRETSQQRTADFDLAFIGRGTNEGSDGPGGTLAYAYFPPVGKIRFDATEPWTEKYDDNNYNLRLVATHEIGHALGLDHSYDKSSIMNPYYQLIQPKDLLPKDDRDGIRALYGSKHPSSGVTVMVKEYQHFSASCPAASMPVILSAIYQSELDPVSCSKDVTDVIRRRCSGKKPCSFAVTNEVLKDDPCFGALKELQIVYSCSNDRYIFGPVLSNTDSSGNDIYTTTAKMDEYQHFSTSCPASSMPVILSAIYQSKLDSVSCSKDVTDVIRRQCSGKKPCSFAVTNEVLKDDPCVGALKELQIVYSCGVHKYGRANIENVQSIEACGEYCLAETRCVGVVYAPRTRTCWLKDAMVARRTVNDKDSMVVLNRDRYLKV